jgi:hypothetical protein
VIVVVDIAHRKRAAQLPALGRGALRSLQAAREDMQLRLRHRALQAEQEPVVEAAQVVDAVGIDDQGVGQAAQL